MQVSSAPHGFFYVLNTPDGALSSFVASTLCTEHFPVIKECNLMQPSYDDRTGRTTFIYQAASKYEKAIKRELEKAGFQHLEKNPVGRRPLQLSMLGN